MGFMNKQQIILITGAGKGLGKALHLHFSNKNYRVLCHYRNTKPEEIKNTKTFQADLAKKQDVEKLFSKITNVDIVIHATGDFIHKDIESTSAEEFKNVIESNLLTAFLCLKEAVKKMKKQKYGKIITIGCSGADRITIQKNTTPYYIAKAGVIMLTKLFAEKHQKNNITINSISPGILEKSVKKPKSANRKEISYEDIINAIEFLIKDKSKNITGANLEVSAGWIPGFSDKSSGK